MTGAKVLGWCWRACSGGVSGFLWKRGVLRPRPGHGPDILCIGQQKAATSWLHRCLVHHPRIVTTQKKEYHFFSSPNRPRVGWYLAQFRPDPSGRLKFDMTPNYSALSDEEVKLARAVCPRARIIFIIRDPVQRAWSHAWQKFAHRGGVPLEEVDDLDFLWHYCSDQCVAFSLATRTIGVWLKHYPRGQVHIDHYAAIQRDPRAFIERVMRFLELDPDEADWSAMPLRRRIHASDSQEMPAKHRAFLEAQYRAEKDKLRAWFGSDVFGETPPEDS